MLTRQDASTNQPGAGKQHMAASEPTMHVKVYSPYQTYFDQYAYSISALNQTGPFDILPHHHSFMTLLSPCELNIRTSVGENRIRIARGIMHVHADSVVVFLDV